MSLTFNTGSSRITGEMMRWYASRLLGKPAIDVSPAEAIAAKPALQAYVNGASAERCRSIFEAELKGQVK